MKEQDNDVRKRKHLTPEEKYQGQSLFLLKVIQLITL